MFRRRDEDENADSGNASQGSLLGSSETVKLLNPEAAAYAPPPSAAHGMGTSPSYAPSRSAAQENPAPRQSAPAQSGNGFRSNQMQGDMPRQRNAETKPASTFSTPTPTGAGRESRRVLTVGTDILLKGEIATCDRLVIEGKVDAVLNDVGTVELAENGSFKGIAQVENAEISGLFEGELLVKGRLVIYASGRVRGKISYGEIEIERGGELTGEIKTIAASGTTRNAARTTVKEEKEKVVAA